MSNSLAQIRQLAFLAQQGRCYYCDHTMWLHTSSEDAKAKPRRYQCTAEHLVPASEGGPTVQQNIVAACFYCNNTRHKAGRPLSPLLYRVHVQRHLQRGHWHGHR
jgi:5-methylcytosine-specific restriction endonuclease McrA